MNSLACVVVSAANAIGVTSYVADSTSPQLTTFALNMDTEQLTLGFDEPVEASLVTISNIVLVSSSASYALMAGVSSQQSPLVIVIQISTSDIDAIKLRDVRYTKP
jgi:hypothetical protein